MTYHPVRIVIIGVGVIARIHARALQDIDNVRLVAASCRSEDKGMAFGEEFRCQYYQDNATMLDQVAPDVAIICTPSGTHEAVAIECFDRGIHVLCEKPLEITAARIDRMIDRAQQAGVRLGGVFPQRYHPAIVRIHEAATGGRFGGMTVLASYVPWWRDHEYYAPERWQGKLMTDGGGALMNQAIHSVDLVQWLGEATGAGPVVEVFGYTGQLGHPPTSIEVEDTAVAVLRFANGALGQLLGATSIYPGLEASTLIAGSDGSVEIAGGTIKGWQFRNEYCHDNATRKRFATREVSGGSSDPAAIGYANHRSNIADFLDALREERTYTIDGIEARKSVAIIEAIYRSATEGVPVRVLQHAFSSHIPKA